MLVAKFLCCKVQKARGQASAKKKEKKNRKRMSIANDDSATNLTISSESIRELFEACKTGDLVKVKKFINPGTVNARDKEGRKSTALHFASGK